VFSIRYSLLMACVLVVCCGGESKFGSSAGNGDAGTDETTNAPGGAPAGGLSQAGNTCVCPIAFGGAGGEGGGCDPATLWRAIGAPGGFLVCRAAPPNLDPTQKPGPGRGAVVLDADGRVIDNTGLDGATKQAWLDELAAQRWPCLAGQTLGYACSSHD
jgi:hypothetical protein